MPAPKKEEEVVVEEEPVFQSKTLTAGPTLEEMVELESTALSEEPVPEPDAPPAAPGEPVPDVTAQIEALKAELETAKHESAGRLGQITQLRDNTRQQGALLDMLRNQAQTAQASQIPQGPQIDPDGVVTGQQLIDVLKGFAEVSGKTYGAPLQDLRNTVAGLKSQAELGVEYRDVVQNEIGALVGNDPELQAMAKQTSPEVLYKIGLAIRKMRQATAPTQSGASVAPAAPVPTPPAIFPSSNPGGGGTPGLTMERVRQYAQSGKPFDQLPLEVQAALIPKD